ncbi:uncharacterized protein LOC116025905 isoform X1 [Ipomoea triloba]|uniref:uncharacterized protein LOC116025905 isoform X1 n=1 Tax=Ipomoea triloba TaxID=35885 RepID=UPI00125D4354|nr:uncharacterized protein LOC116025905 isoform X1 [Ipomoea triloba]
MFSMDFHFGHCRQWIGVGWYHYQKAKPVVPQQVCSECDSVKISLDEVIYIVPTFSRHEFIYMISMGFCFGECNGVGIATRSKTSGASAWVGDECSVEKNKHGSVDFEVAITVGEVVEVFAEFHPLHTLFVFEMQRNSDGQEGLPCNFINLNYKW